MKKISIISFIFILLVISNNLFAIDIELGRTLKKKPGLTTFTHQLNLGYKRSYKKVNYSVNFNFKEDEIETITNIFANFSKDINKNFDIWGEVAFKDDVSLNINDRIDSKIGFGYVLIKKNKFFSKRKMKISYGLILRQDHLLHSFRFKDKYSIAGMGYSFFINYIFPNGSKHFEELDIRFKPFLNIKILNLQPSLNYEYLKNHYSSRYDEKFTLSFSL